MSKNSKPSHITETILISAHANGHVTAGEMKSPSPDIEPSPLYDPGFEMTNHQVIPETEWIVSCD